MQRMCIALKEYTNNEIPGYRAEKALQPQGLKALRYLNLVVPHN